MSFYTISKPFIFTIFGASGDLAKIKIFPALYSLMKQNRFGKNFYIVGYARTPKSRQEFQKEFIESVKKFHGEKVDMKVLNRLVKQVYYFSGQYNSLHNFKEFRQYLTEIAGNRRIPIMAYFSVPPQVFKDIIQNLGLSRKNENEDLRLIIEKPFGEDSESAKELFHFVARYFTEDKVYLLDHYLGKSAVQSILHLRHTNRILNFFMKGAAVSNIQITAFENFGVKDRIGYFDQVGTIKDMVQSHLLQILALMTMSIPITESDIALHREKQSILSALKVPDSSKNIVIGQYKGYQKLKDVPHGSQTETFAALRMFIDRESWYKVPIYLRTGKQLHKKHSYVVVEIQKFPFQAKAEQPNRLILELQPNERINISLINKHGGMADYQEIRPSDSLACFGTDCLPEHGNLILDVIRGRKIHFLSFPEILASWDVAGSIMDIIKRNKLKPEMYADNCEGPESQHRLTKMDGFEWYDVPLQ